MKISIIRILGVLLFALGVTYFTWGMNLTEGFSERFLKQMAGEYPEEARRYIFRGVVMGVLGASIVVMTFFRGSWWKKRKNK